MLSTIQYPFAQTADGPVEINEYSKQSGIPITCVGCDRPVVAKQGAAKKQRWHFAHASNAERECNGETALHRVAKALVVRGFRRARHDAAPYFLRWTCPHCEVLDRVDCTRFWTDVATEVVATPGVRGDLLFLGDRPFAVEIVVAHELEDRTAARYVAADIPVFVVHPTWETVSQLSTGVQADGSLGLSGERCRACAAIRADEAMHSALFDAVREYFRSFEPTDVRAARAEVAEWPPALDRFGARLFPRVRAAVRENAIQLVRLGFKQSQNNRWIFWRSLPHSIGMVYALLGGDDLEPLWRNPAPTLSLDLSLPDAQVDRFGELVAGFLTGNGMALRDDYA